MEGALKPSPGLPSYCIRQAIMLRLPLLPQVHIAICIYDQLSSLASVSSFQWEMYIQDSPPLSMLCKGVVYSHARAPISVPRGTGPIDYSIIEGNKDPTPL
jgi:hypothetical protein